MQDNEELRFSLLSNCHNPILVINPDTSVRYLNRALEKLTGFTSAKVIGRKAPYPWWTEGTLQKTSRDLDKTMSKRTKQVEELFQKKNGERFQVEITSTPVRSNGQLKYYLESWVDISERKQIDEELKQREKKYHTFFKTSRDCVFITSKDGSWIDFNDAAVEFFGYENGNELRKVRIPELYEDPKEREIVARAVEQQGFIKDFATTLRKKDGSIINALVTSVARKDENGTVMGYQGTIKDITERKRVEEQLRRSTEQLRNLSAYLQSAREEERARIARQIHDELGQTLTALKMDICWLGKRLVKGQESLSEKIELMTKLIDVTLQVVKRISAELRPGLLDELGVAAAIEWQAQEFQEATGIQCKVAFSSGDITLDYGRSTTAFRIFQEALTNVFRHADATRVVASLKEGPGKVLLTVSDNGKGITPEQISDPKAFGLIGMQERAHSWGGEVKISGVRGKGTTIRVTIPLGRQENINAENSRR